MANALHILLRIALLVAAARLCGALAGRLKLPVVLGELLAGVALGPTFFSFWTISWWGAQARTSAISAESAFQFLAQIGVTLLMFAAGLETDLEAMRAAVAPAFWSATGGVILPLLGGAIFSHALGLDWQESLFVGAILCATSVTITAQTLIHLKQIRSRVGATILGAAVIDDVLGLVVLSMLIALRPGAGRLPGAGWHGLAVALDRLLLFLVTTLWLGPRLTRWLLGYAASIHMRYLELVAGVALAFSLAAHAAFIGGMAAITGAYLAGLFIAATPSHRRVTHQLLPLIAGFFGPVFFVSIGLNVNARSLAGHLVFFCTLFLVAIVGKILGSGMGAFFNKLGLRESLIVGIGMIPRGEVGLITASIGWSAGIVSRDIYVQIVGIVLATTLITPGMLRLAFPNDSLAEAVATGASLDNVLHEPAEDVDSDVEPNETELR